MNNTKTDRFRPNAKHCDVLYGDLLQHVMNDGIDKTDRTGTGTRSVFGHQMRFDLNEGFPLLTTKKVHVRSVFHELLWFIKGDTNIKYLNDNGVTIWDEWADQNGELGPVYGSQWRRWIGRDGVEYDQITNAVNLVKDNPGSRRIIVSAWNVSEIGKMKLPPCHCLFQLYVGNGKLSCQLYQRSADMFLGVPFNIASYAALTQMIAQVTKLSLGTFIWTGGDIHIYHNHFKQVELQLSRMTDIRPMPTLKLNPEVMNIFDFKYEDFCLEGYNPHPSIKADIAV